MLRDVTCYLSFVSTCPRSVPESVYISAYAWWVSTLCSVRTKRKLQFYPVSGSIVCVNWDFTDEMVTWSDRCVNFHFTDTDTHADAGRCRRPNLIALVGFPFTRTHYTFTYMSHGQLNTLLKHMPTLQTAPYTRFRKGESFSSFLLFLSEVSVTAHNERFVVVCRKIANPAAFPTFPREPYIIPWTVSAYIRVNKTPREAFTAIVIRRVLAVWGWGGELKVA